ncbi:MAG TPA: hypothetical protein ENH35_02610, partial [Candidatus Moranbacteria bacterium]|nr:hypothetical protein [Candidatus Moranbacteria bacterium]
MQQIISLKGSLDEEQELGIKGIFPEECGLSAAVNIPFASEYAFKCASAQDHRGEKGVGIVSVRKSKFYIEKRRWSVILGLPGVNFKKDLPGKTAIVHNRYATEGDSDSPSNVQPLVFQETSKGSFVLAHNGTMNNVRSIKKDLMKKGVAFQSTTDSEIMAHLITHSNEDTIEKAIISALNQITAAYSLLILTPNKLFAIRDRFGIRPLSIGKLKSGFLVCSENYAFDQYPSSSYLREVEPGEIIVFEKNKDSFESIKYAEPDEHFCIFEGIYFSHPRTTYKEYYNEDFRQELGKQILIENPDLQGDFILPVLDSGKHAAIGLFKKSRIDYKEYFLRKHKTSGDPVSRSFTSATYQERKEVAFKKLHLRKDKIRGKSVVVVDDSIVRSTTMKIACERLRNAGASYITVCISAPPIVSICPNGMAYRTRKQLTAYNRTTEDVRKTIGADRLIYLSLKGLKDVVGKTYKCGICTGCFGGK